MAIRPLLLLLSTGILTIGFAQTNMHFTNADLTAVFAGDYQASDFEMRTDYGSPEALVAEINDAVSSDTLKALLVEMQQFETRNSGSDTLSPVRGMGAARNWVVAQFDRFRFQQDDRLLTGFFQFDQDICGMQRHKNAVAILPGTDPRRGVVIIEAHLDSRCDQVCDVNCEAQGMEDNGSGTALVIELARVLSRYNYPSTIVFMATTGEEQGLVGANALAEYAEQNGVSIHMVQNNDIVGGIICGETSSPPSCPGVNHIDSTQVRLFSAGGFDSPHKGICRYVKLQYEEMLKPIVDVPMLITIMNAEDREGRGGDHIPFRERGYPAMRFTSANEHGDAGVGPDYHDRQHTSDDILGLDLDGDEVLDTFFVNFNYLARNTVINATSAVMAAMSPPAPVVKGAFFDSHTFYIEMEEEPGYAYYRIGLRTDFTDFDTMYTLQGQSAFFETGAQEFFVFLSVMGVDSNGVESLPLEELRVRFSGIEETQASKKNIQLLQNRPNPFDESTIIAYWADEQVQYKSAEIVISDMSGKIIKRLPTTPQEGMNEVVYFHGYGASGAYVYALIIDGIVVDQKRMIFAN